MWVRLGGGWWRGILLEHYGGTRVIMFVTDIGSSFWGWKWRVKKPTEWG